MNEALIAEIAVSNTAYTFDCLFSYVVPEKDTCHIKCGCRVLVPFGRGNKSRTGMVLKLRKGDASELKEIISQIDSEPVLSDELLLLVGYMRDTAFCTYYEAVKAMLPPAMNVKVSEKLAVNPLFEAYDELTNSQLELLERIRLSKGSCNDDFISENSEDLEILKNKCAVSAENIFRNAVGDNTVKMVRLTEKYIQSPEEFRLTPKQKKTAELLMEYGCASEKEAAYMCGVTLAVVKRLIANGVAEEFECEVLRSVGVSECTKRDISDVRLSDEQQNVFDSVSDMLENRQYQTFLLHGVTGSGKTSVFEKLIDKTISLGRQALLLIPEISLTPQILRGFRGIFGERVAVIHSSLSLGQRLDEYKRIKRGEADIVIGTRSAIFAPLDNIGIIIMDEEGERSYKSDSTPRYNTSDIAKFRCRNNNAVLVLASATPTIESYYNAEKGVYKLLEMKKRYHSDLLPKVEIVDMNIERQNGNNTEFSQTLVDEIRLNLKNGEQTILLLNRRGYHTIISCCDCNEPVYCPNCTVPMTFHKINGKLMCHYCGYTSDMATTCAKCGSDRLKKMGFGTQRLEEELEMYFPDARILRMDADTTFSRYAYEEKFGAFGRGEYDIMIGTQMIGKGLDFPNVTLVGVLSVDKSLFAGDFRSYERTFSLITQVVGRGGRGQKQGRAYLQTFMPDHYVMCLAAEQDYETFYNEEIAIRRAMVFPPVCDMCIIGISGITDFGTKIASDRIIDVMTEYFNNNNPKTPIRVIGPVKCSYGKINGKYRYRIIMKCKNTSEIRNAVREILSAASRLKECAKINMYADMNGDIGV
jgi:primosomal protein N' (replication factor Y)